MADPDHAFCPLYREARAALPEAKGDASHLGLRFDKFADGWFWSGHASPSLQFDPPGKTHNWLDSFARRGGQPTKCGDRPQITEACIRQRELVTQLGGRVAIVTNTSRFVTGMGRQHPSENGFVWHPTLGTPFLPGSSLKGMLRSWNQEIAFDPANGPNPRFGAPGKVGDRIFFDLLPVEPPRLAIEVMTPHYGGYYQQAEIPGDWHSPIPIRFLAVEAGAYWQVAIAPRRPCAAKQSSPDRSPAVSTTDSEFSILLEAIEIEGLGAKTAVGLGRFRVDTDAEKRFQDRICQIREAERRQRKAADDAAVFERELAESSEPLRQLKRRQKAQQWQLSAGDRKLITALEEFAESHPAPPDDAVHWIRELLESIPNYRGVWDDPDATRGKSNKKKWKYGSAKIRELVRRLNPTFRK